MNVADLGFLRGDARGGDSSGPDEETEEVPELIVVEAAAML